MGRQRQDIHYKIIRPYVGRKFYMYDTTTILDSGAGLRWNRVALFIIANHHQNCIRKAFPHRPKRRQQFRQPLVSCKATNVTDHLGRWTGFQVVGEC